MEVIKQSKRNFFGGGFNNSIKIEAKGKFSAIQLSRFFSSLVSHLPIHSSLRNLKGKGNEEELLYVGGSLLPLSEDEAEKSFSLRYCSEFKSFEGKKHILYNISKKNSGAILDHGISPGALELSRMLPISFKEIRVGTEYFSSKFFGSMLGFAPQVTKRYYLEASTERLCLEIIEEEQKKREQFSSQAAELIEIWLKSFSSWDICPELAKVLK